jgi:EpsI family protein
MSKRVVFVAAVAASLMAVCSWFGAYAQPQTRMADLHPRSPLAQVLPAAFGDWRVDEMASNVELPPDVAAQVKAIYTEVADRVYVNNKGERIMLTIAYGRDQSDGFKVHRPEVCYAAQGFTVASPQDATLSLGSHDIDVKHVDTHMGARKEPVTYWMVIGDQVVSTATRHKLQQVRYALDGLIADGLLVRVSSLSPEPEAAYAAQAAFVREWRMHVPPSQRGRLFGQ